MLFFQFQCICIYRDFSEPNKQHGFQSQPLQLTRGNIVISSTSSISKIFKTNSLCKTEGASSTQITLFRIFLIQPFNYAETKLVVLKNIESQHPNFFLFLIKKLYFYVHIPPEFSKVGNHITSTTYFGRNMKLVKWAKKILASRSNLMIMSN